MIDVIQTNKHCNFISPLGENEDCIVTQYQSLLNLN
jgi:hypothetical protein